MKILHTADLHLGSPMTTHLSPDRVRQRKSELVATLERMVEEAVYLGARLFIIVGDLFDDVKVGKRLCERVLGVMSRTTSLDFLYLPGNHEKNAIVESGLPLPSNLKIFGKDWTYYTYGDVTLAGRSELTADMLESLRLNQYGRNIVLLHGALADRSTGEDAIGIRDCADRHIDYLALGHYHSYGVTELDERGYAVYCGTPEGRGFDETGEKGFVIIDTDRTRVEHKFIPFARRRLHWLRVDLTGAVRGIDVEDAVALALGRIKPDDMVRVELTGERHPELFVDIDAIVARFADAFYHFECRDSSRTLIDPEAYRYDKSLKGEFIRLCIAREDLSDEDREAIIRVGLAALMDESTEV